MEILTAESVSPPLWGQAAPITLVDTGRRLITGMFLPFNEYGSTNIGIIRVRGPEAIELPADLSRIKLSYFHTGEQRSTSVGYAQRVWSDDQGMWGEFKVDSTEDGDKALMKAQEHTMDGLSVELSPVSVDAQDYATGVLRAVAQVPVPAFDSARVTNVAAQFNPESETRMYPCTQCGQAHVQGEQYDHEAVAPAAAPEAPVAPPAAANPAESAQVPAAAAASLAPVVHAGNGSPSLSAAVPAGLAAQAQPRQPGDGWTMADFMEALKAQHTGRKTPELTAALQNITQTANAVVEAPQFVGELWNRNTYQRKIVPLVSHDDLKSYSVKGWRWATPPVMAAWAGDKNAVPSNAADTEDASVNASRLAGAHDFDRKFRDFNNTEFFESYYKAMSNSYAKLSDAALVDALEAGATDLTATGEGFLAAIAEGVAAIGDSSDVGSTFVIANNADFLPWLMATTNFDLPAFMDLLGVDPRRIKTHSSMTAGHVLVGASGAATFYELPGVPIRAEAIDMVLGGVDAGVFGYYATLINDAGGLQDVTINAGA